MTRRPDSLEKEANPRVPVYYSRRGKDDHEKTRVSGILFCPDRQPISGSPPFPEMRRRKRTLP